MTEPFPVAVLQLLHLYLSRPPRESIDTSLYLKSNAVVIGIEERLVCGRS